jgi:hypothetical protein
VWLTWRQHRIAIVLGAVFVAAYYAVALAVRSGVPGNLATCSPHCGQSSVFGLGWVGTWVLVDGQMVLAAAFGLLVAVFWAAPLIAREYEQGTDVLAWGQDLSVTGWLFGKIATLGVIAAGYGAIVGFAASGLVSRFGGFLPFGFQRFESSVPLQAAYALFGFLLGVAVSAFVRRTVPAMGVTAALFVAVRLVVYELRFTYLPPVHVVLSSPANVFTYLFHGLLVDENANGTAIDYQPPDRLPAFRLIEIAIFVVLTAALATVTWLRMRRKVVRMPAPTPDR